MSALGEAPDDVEEALVAYLSGLRRTAIGRRPARDPLPMNLVRNIPGGTERAEYGLSDQLVSVRTLCDKNLGEKAAMENSADTHEWMLTLAREQVDIHIPGGRIVNFDYVNVVESPHWIDFADDQVLCRLARYSIGLSYVRTTS
ncbi:hypothetical protein [Mycolicibacterium canariasense]|uniref:hypothetical protein n=1 Tax=Mycolicibacterium canariasense TaxID=228230 RepID=UPI000A14AAD0|nr:hypothetical protein [Mycolicibacterium canariasense]MCV7208413.1 hypothetical protein [Mycolicibacterium canariasense]ORV13592.1 hypothetical protein AWB94_05075 [Mycolicibacterium canariasense]